ncbi:ATP-binding cassette sub-family A member 3 [Elysia marginata]|uniref:ATP-binding cassette sub-family A member 3 n=1 Tax=Elysia marginata TaxID=1093978 RepID=A0AAV4GIH8_9GAST|nr:ATP-binding cassette sub-family A member 3 [Elysia marginata]
MEIRRQLRLLLWKNLRIKVRQPITLAAEVLLPLLCALLLVVLRPAVKVKVVNETLVRPAHDPIFPTYLRNKDSVIAYAPKTGATALVMKLFRESFLREYKTVGFSKMIGLGLVDKTVTEWLEMKKIPLLIEFHNVTNKSLQHGVLPTNLLYTLRPRVGDLHLDLAKTYPFPPYNWPPRSEDDRLGLSGLQYLLGQAVARYWAVQARRDPWAMTFRVQAQSFPFPAYREDPMVLILQNTLAAYLVTSFLGSVILFTKAIVVEKQFKLKETMKLVGMKPSAYWLSWLLSSSLYFTPVLAVYTFLMSVVSLDDSPPVLASIDPSLFFAFMLCYGLALITFCFLISTFINRDEGTRWTNYHLPPFPEDNLSLRDCMLMLLVDSLLHCVLAWYLDHVKPGEHGIAKVPWFCFKISYWVTPGKGSVSDLPRLYSEITKMCFETEPADMEPGVQIVKLRKVFGNKQVVRGTTLNMYKGQIFVLIGHNGSGKTVTIGMITGNCNILLKGLSGRELTEDVHAIAAEMGLGHKFNTQARSLCAGHKRRLSVAIAIVGKPDVVILDEPTAGMDPEARRDTWLLLKRIRKDRTILLTTHFMDEADLLGDRIAIMDEGEVRCCGTPAFLKDLYGSGFHLVITVHQEFNIFDLMEVIHEHRLPFLFHHLTCSLEEKKRRKKDSPLQRF